MRLSGWNLPLEQLSATAISDFIQCPEAFRQKRLLKRKESMNSARFVGIVDHKTHEENFRQKIHSGEDLTPEEMYKSYADNWETTTNHEGEPEWEEDPIKTFNRGAKMIELYHEKVSPTIQPIAVEQRFEERIKNVPVPVVGYVDVETKDVIRERKTSATKLKDPKTRWRFQGRIYQLALDKPISWDIITKQVTPQVVTAQDAPGLFMGIQNKDMTVLMIQRAVEALTDTYDRYGKDTPWPTNGLFAEAWACQWCSFQDRCIAWN